MHSSDIAYLRLVNQQLIQPRFLDVPALMRWMGAVQAQDYAMAKWALGVRLPQSNITLIDTALNESKIVRTHVLRPTWHFVSIDDIHWMLSLSAVKIKNGLKARYKQLELDDRIVTKCKKLIVHALEKELYLSREALIACLNKANVDTNDNRASHILMHAELDGLICSGAVKAHKSTYTLLDRIAPNPQAYSQEEALAMLARKYIQSHGPATLQDFVWWSGLNVSTARKAIASIKNELEEINIDDVAYLVYPTNSSFRKEKKHLCLLPAFDEFLIAYKDRTASVLSGDAKHIFSNNGIFWPVILSEGKAIGLWKRIIKKEHCAIELQLFNQSAKTPQSALQNAMEAYAFFMDKKLIETTIG